MEENYVTVTLASAQQKMRAVSRWQLTQEAEHRLVKDWVECCFYWSRCVSFIVRSARLGVFASAAQFRYDRRVVETCL